MIVKDAEQRSRIAEIQKAIHGAIAGLHVCILYTESDREEQDVDRAYIRALELETLLGELMTDGDPITDEELADKD